MSTSIQRLERLERLQRLAKCNGYDVFTYDDLWENSDIRYGDMNSRGCIGETDSAFVVPYASGSDYSGGSVEKSNHAAFLELFGNLPYVHNARGGYDTYAIAIDINVMIASEGGACEQILDMLEALENYPLIDEDKHSELEMSLQSEAWDNWVKSDFIRELEQKFDCELDTDIIVKIVDDKNLQLFDVGYRQPKPSSFAELFYRSADSANEYWVIETGCSAYIRLEKIVDCIKLDDIKPWIVSEDYANV